MSLLLLKGGTNFGPCCISRIGGKNRKETEEGRKREINYKLTVSRATKTFLDGRSRSRDAVFCKQELVFGCILHGRFGL